MPKLLPATEKLRTKNLVKSCIKNGLNQSELARQIGVSQQAINQRVNRAPVQKTLQAEINKCLSRAGISRSKVYRKLDEQLEAKDKGIFPDHIARDKAIGKCLNLMGHIKQVNDNGKGATVLILHYGHRDTITDSSIRAEARPS